MAASDREHQETVALARRTIVAVHTNPLPPGADEAEAAILERLALTDALCRQLKVSLAEVTRSK